MATRYPGALDRDPNELPDNIADSDTLDSPNHATVHNNVNGAVLQIEEKLGIGDTTASAGAVLHGTAAGESAWTSDPSIVGSLSVAKDSADAVINLTAHHDTEATAAELTLRKSDGSKASPALVDDDAVLGKIMFQGYDGNSYANGAQIIAQVDGTPADGDMPTELIFQVTPDGGSETPATAMTIKPSKNVGIGSAAPTQSLVVLSDDGNLSAGDVSDGTKATLFLENSGGAKADGNLATGIGFSGTDTGRRRAMIASFQDGSDGDPHGLQFFTYGSTSTASDAVTSRVTIGSDGNVGIGTTSPERILDIRGASNPEIRLQSTDSSDTAIYFGDESDAVQAGIFFDNSENDLCFRGHDNVTRFKILSSGTTQFDNTMTVGANGSGQDAVLYSNTSGSYALWDEDSTLHSFNGVLRFIGNSGLSFAGTTAGADNEQIAFAEGYEINADNAGYGTGSSRFWLGGGDGGACYIGPRSGSDTWTLIRLSATAISLLGTVSKTAGSFDIAHPSKGGDWRLRHSFIEGPTCDNIYRGTATISGGSVTVDLDTVSNMTDGTWEALNTNPWSMVASSGNAVTWSLSGKTLTINGPDGAVCSWMVIGERKDQGIIDSPMTDSNGKLIVEYEDAEREACPEE